MILGFLPSMMATAELVVPVKASVYASRNHPISSSTSRVMARTQIDTDDCALHLALRLGRLIASKPGAKSRPSERGGARDCAGSRKLMARKTR